MSEGGNFHGIVEARKKVARATGCKGSRVRGHHTIVTSEKPINPMVDQRAKPSPINHRIDNMFNEIQWIVNIINKPANNGVLRW